MTPRRAYLAQVADWILFSNCTPGDKRLILS